MRKRIHATLLLAGLAATGLTLAMPSVAQPPGGSVGVWENADGTISAGKLVFDSWESYLESDFFMDNGMRCGTPRVMASVPGAGGGMAAGTQADCTDTLTNPDPSYDPSTVLYRIPVVVHVIQHPNGSGFISDSQVQSQIDILNEDFLALAGSNGAAGTDVQVEFYLATTDPSGNPTNGITRHTKASWYNDGGSYWASIGWDTTRYLNIYTNTASGNLGYAYVPNGGGVVGQPWDRVVIFWRAFGRNSGYAPYDQGRTTTHEVGHYLGLYHTFDPNGACPSAGGCYTNGDLICDTEPELQPHFGNCFGSSCGSPDPWMNYMDYSDDLCMTEFTPDQARRMRCTLENWRVDLPEIDGNPTGGCCVGASCSLETAGDCAALGGTWLGAGTNCGGSPCSTPTGGCCVGTTCSIETAADCASLGGTYQGDGTGCSPNPCGGTGDPVEAPVTAGTVTRGSLVSGFLNDLYDSDDSSVLIDAAKQGKWYRTELEIVCTSPHTSISRLDLTTEVGVDGSGISTTISLFNYASNSWTDLETYAQPLPDTVKTYLDVANPNNYVNAATGEIQVKIFTQVKNVDHITRTDHVEVIVTP